MITIVDAGPNVLGYRVDGTIEKRDIERVAEDMDAKIAEPGKLRLYVELSAMTGISPQALLRDLQLAIPRVNYLTRIERLAVVTDSDLIRSLAGMQSHFATSMEIKVYPSTAAPTAIQWLAA